VEPLRHHTHDQSAFGTDKFGVYAERLARFFGTPRYIIGQSIIVVLWIFANAFLVAFRWDPYPFILLNLAFSTQAAYAAPLILLAQTRQSDRDKALAEAQAKHLEETANQHRQMLAANTELTEANAKLTREIHELLAARPRARRKAT